MSLYSYLNTPIPVITYCALHQAQIGVPRDEYIKTMKELHQRIAQESREINAGYGKHLVDAIARECQSLQNSLAHFLQTPISSDNNEVRSMLVESFGRFKDQILPSSPTGLNGSLEGRVSFVTSKKPLERKLLKNGKSYLTALGLTTIKGHPDIFESSFTVEGAMNLDVLEHIVRDRLGIYSTTHGKHIKEFSGYSYAAYNLAFAQGEVPPGGEIQKHVELAFFFSKPDMKYAPFRNGLSEVLEKLAGDIKVKHISLWQRKLGLGAGREFVLRIISEESKTAADIVDWLNGYEEKKFVRESIIGSGHLVVKELLFRA